MSDLYYDPWAVDIDLDPYPDLPAAARRAAAVLQRATRLLGSEQIHATSTRRCGIRSGSALPRATSSKSSRPTR